MMKSNGISKQQRVCYVDGCGRKHIAKDLCTKHYQKYKIHGDPLGGISHEIHGMKNSREYRSWQQMKERCHNPNSFSYRYYGGRGITVCDKWRKSFSSFFSDVGRCPEGRSIDRIDNDKGYSPENCRWATRKEQSNNKSCCRRFLYNGKEYTSLELAKIAGINRGTMYSRLVVLGWSVSRSLNYND